MVSAVNKRKEKDVMKLLVSDYQVQVINEALNNEFIVKFCGPKDSPYEGVSIPLFSYHFLFDFSFPTFSLQFLL